MGLKFKVMFFIFSRVFILYYSFSETRTSLVYIESVCYIDKRIVGIQIFISRNKQNGGLCSLYFFDSSGLWYKGLGALLVYVLNLDFLFYF